MKLAKYRAIGVGSGAGSFTREHLHLCRRTEFIILGPTPSVANRVPDTLGHGARPFMELSARPRKTVIFVTQLASGKRLKANIVLDVWRSHDHRLRPPVVEHNPLERREPRRVEVLDHLHTGRRLEALQLPVTVRQRTVDMFDRLNASNAAGGT